MIKGNLGTKLAFGAGAFATALVLACGGGEDRPSVDVIEDGTGSGSVSGSASGTGSGSASGTGSGSVSGSASGAPSEPTDDTYQTVSNVDIYYQMAADLRDIRAIMQPATEGNSVDWDATIDIYENGKNQTRGDGELRTLASIPNEDVYAIFPDGASVYGSDDFINELVRDGLNGTGQAEGLGDAARRQMVDKGIQMLIYAKALQEMEAASTRVAEGNTDNESGAPHAVDEAWAAIAGVAEEDGSRPHGLLNTATSREGNFGLEGKLRAPLEQALVDALAAAQAGEVEDFEEAHTRVKGYLNGIFYLASLRYANSLVSDETPEDREVHLAEGRTFFQTIRAHAAAGDAGAAETVQTAYSSSPDEAFPASRTQEVYDALNQDAVLAAMDLPGDLIVRTPPQ